MNEAKLANLLPPVYEKVLVFHHPTRGGTKTYLFVYVCLYKLECADMSIY